VDDLHTLVLGERGAQLFSGSVYTSMATLIGEGRTVDDILAAAPPSVSAAEIYYALDRLEVRGVIRESSDVPGVSAGFWDAVGADPAAAVHTAGQSRVKLAGIGAAGLDPLTRSLSALGVEVELEDGEDCDVTIVLTEDYLHPDLAAINQARLQDGKPWLIARPTGSILWIGPLFRKGVTACWACMAHRVRAQRFAESYVQVCSNGSHPRAIASYSLPSTESAAAALVATEIIKWLAGAASPELETSLLTLDLATMSSERHPVVRRPQCPVCGDAGAATRPPQPISLQSRTKSFTSDGGFRSEPPETTLSRYSRHVSPLTGVVTHLARNPALASPVTPVYFAGLNAARRNDSIESLRDHFRGGSGGKGKTEAQAKAGAMAEAIERYSGIFDGSEPRIRASLEDLGAAAIHPNDCMRFSERQYAQPRGASVHRFNRVPVPFDERAELEWSALWSLTFERFRYLPAAYCYYDYPLPAEQRFSWANSNGCAAGNSLEEAILQGFLELVERDCVAVWWYNRIIRPAVDLASFDEPYFAAFLGYYRSLHRDVWVLDLTADFGLPAFTAVSRSISGPTEELIMGFGCHLDPRLGILRALTEMNQFLPVVIARSSDPNASFDTMDQDTLSWLTTATLATQPHLAPASGTTVAATDYKQFEHGDLKDDVEACVRIAAERGMETLVLDQTRPDIGLPVVRVVVPGMRPFWQRLAPGRLYDVPVALGWLPAPLAEEELNPVPVFF